jgi:nitrate/TMAO reductase-like tetraheme cytochrome c subunit
MAPAGSAIAADKTQPMFIGATKCKTCHKTEAQGEQYPMWLKGPHAKAYEALASDAAKAIAKEKGIADAQKSDECLQCHVTGHGVAAEFHGTKYDATEGITCEGCHGAGGDYYKKKAMVAVISGEIEADSVGLVKPTEETCVQCHNEKSPSFKEFDFKKAYAQIKHAIPDERKAKYKAAP